MSTHFCINPNKDPVILWLLFAYIVTDTGSKAAIMPSKFSQGFMWHLTVIVMYCLQCLVLRTGLSGGNWNDMWTCFLLVLLKQTRLALRLLVHCHFHRLHPHRLLFLMWLCPAGAHRPVEQDSSLLCGLTCFCHLFVFFFFSFFLLFLLIKRKKLLNHLSPNLVVLL